MGNRSTKRKKAIAGRPTKYKPEYCDMLIEHLSKGLSLTTFCATIGIVQDTLYRWFKEHPNFSEAKKIGIPKSQLFWELLGIGGTTGKIGGFNSTAWIFNMKNRFKWTDRQEIKHEMPEPIIIKTSKGEEKLDIVRGAENE